MRTTPTRTILSLFTISLFASPVPASAGSNPEPVPLWVPVTFGVSIATSIAIHAFRTLRQGGPNGPRDPRQEALDVIRYISTPAERAELERCASREDVEGFLDRFWLRRDPTPGTVANEFRDEHLRRFRHANEAFREGRDGWKTDRGRAYILFGPPAEVMEIPQAGDGELCSSGWRAVEIWEYARPEGAIVPPFAILRDPPLFDLVFHRSLPSLGRMVLVFADRSGTGSYERVGMVEDDTGLESAAP